MPSDATPTTLLDSCSAEMPVGHVTRVFDFGQFIELYDPGSGPNPQPMPVVVDPVGSLTFAQQLKRLKARNKTGANESDSDSAEAERLGGRSLQLLLDDGNEADAPLVEIDDLAALSDARLLRVGEIEVRVELTTAHRAALIGGADLLLDLPRSDGAGRVSATLRLKQDERALTAAQVSALIATRSLTFDEGDQRPVRLDGAIIGRLLDESPVDTEWLTSSGAVRRRLRLFAAVGTPAPGMVEIADLSAFLARPEAPDTRGRPAPLTLGAQQVAELRSSGESVIAVEGGALRLLVRAREMQLRRAIFNPNGDGGGKDVGDDVDEDRGGGKPPRGSGTAGTDAGGAATGATPLIPVIIGTIVMETPPLYFPPQKDPGDRGVGDLVEPRMPGGRGIPVAVMVPWRQTWTLTGFSRGALISSLALTPQEEMVIELSSWERRTRTLEQSSETDTEQTFESSETTKDSDETFDELTSKQDFTWQVGGSLDASYSPGVASIHVSANANAQSTMNVANVARTTATRSQDATRKAAARVRARRTTRISESIETGSENRVTRRIRNVNMTRTLTFDFFETLAHYEIKLEFVPERLSLVAMIENPELRAGPDFTESLVRQNESTFRNALLEPALVEGFAALRFLAAYVAADGIVRDQQNKQKQQEAVNQPDIPAATQPAVPPDPAAAQLQAVIDVLKQMHAGATALKTRANVDVALLQMRSQKNDTARPINETERRNGQYWLFVQCLASRAPAFLDALIALAGRDIAQLGAADAQRLATAMPGPTSSKSLASIADMTAVEKEEAGLASAIKRFMEIFWDWGWWTQRCREELLYTPNDAGITGLSDKLSQALQAWEAKRAEGAFAKDKDVALQAADQKQDALSTEDRLAMAFPLDEHARACERAAALLGHIGQHPQHYSYALFQALTPAEQVSRILAASGGLLQVGLFEPRVVAMNGSKLAVPLTPLAASGLTAFVDALRVSLKDALEDTASHPEQVVLPTPGVNVASRLGKCTAAEAFIEDSRVNDLDLGRARTRQAQAEADAAAAEAERRAMLLKREVLDPFVMGD